MYYFRSLFVIIGCLLSSCHDHHEDDSKTGHVHGAGYEKWIKGPSSSPLSPTDALKTFALQPGLSVESIVSEPTIQDPVALSFDAKGRMWVAEMTNYMLDVVGTGDSDPIGNIVILEPIVNKGKVQKEAPIRYKRHVFLSGITLPRAIAHVKGGILFSDDHSLNYVSNTNDKAGKIYVVDPTYAKGSNVEKKANGLLLGLDNWIYSAFSNKRYRTYPLSSKIEDSSEEIFRTSDWKLVKAMTDTRGQWGITKDDYGRLYYTHNSVLLIADPLDANASARNPKIKFKEIKQTQLSDNHIYPSRPTLGINRAYEPGILNNENKVISATAVSGAVIYRGTSIPFLYGHGISTEPAANLISAISLTENDGVVSGSPFYPKNELLTSTDERFRPVNAYNAPDGSLYVVDMYRGILQDRFYLSQYLSEYILGKKLDQQVHYGRIYRFTGNGEIQTQTDLSNIDSAELVSYLSHSNAWHRDTAKKLLVERQAHSQDIIRAIKKICLSKKKDYFILNALWTLEGVNNITLQLLLDLLKSESNKIISNAIRLSEKLSKSDKHIFTDNLNKLNLINTDSFDIASSLAISLSQMENSESISLLVKLVTKWHSNSNILSLTLTGLNGREKTFIERLNLPGLQQKLTNLISLPAKKVALPDSLTENERLIYRHGKYVYKIANCSACHGEKGEGINFSGPPLANSEWVTGSKERLAALLLNGLRGPVHVNNKLYDPGSNMPGLKDNQRIGLSQIVALMTYLRNSWGNTGDSIDIETVNKIKQETQNQTHAFTEKELNDLYPEK